MRLISTSSDSPQPIESKVNSTLLDSHDGISILMQLKKIIEGLTNNTLTILELSAEDKFSSDQIDQISDKLQANTSVIRFKIEGIIFNKKMVNALCEQFKKNKNVYYVSLNNCGLDDEAGKQIVIALQLSNLQYLNLNNNKHISDQTLLAFTRKKTTSGDTKLRGLCLQGLSISLEGYKILFANLAKYINLYSIEIGTKTEEIEGSSECLSKLLDILPRFAHIFHVLNIEIDLGLIKDPAIIKKVFELQETISSCKFIANGDYCNLHLTDLSPIFFSQLVNSILDEEIASPRGINQHKIFDPKSLVTAVYHNDRELVQQILSSGNADPTSATYHRSLLVAIKHASLEIFEILTTGSINYTLKNLEYIFANLVTNAVEMERTDILYRLFNIKKPSNKLLFSVLQEAISDGKQKVAIFLLNSASSPSEYTPLILTSAKVHPDLANELQQIISASARHRLVESEPTNPINAHDDAKQAEPHPSEFTRESSAIQTLATAPPFMAKTHHSVEMLSVSALPYYTETMSVALPTPLMPTSSMAQMLSPSQSLTNTEVLSSPTSDFSTSDLLMHQPSEYDSSTLASHVTSTVYIPSILQPVENYIFLPCATYYSNPGVTMRESAENPGYKDDYGYSIIPDDPIVPDYRLAIGHESAPGYGIISEYKGSSGHLEYTPIQDPEVVETAPLETTKEQVNKTHMISTNPVLLKSLAERRIGGQPVSANTDSEPAIVCLELNP